MDKFTSFLGGLIDKFENKMNDISNAIERKVNILKKENIYWKILFILLLPVKWMFQILGKCISWAFWGILGLCAGVMSIILAFICGIVYRLLWVWWGIYLFNIAGARETYPVGESYFNGMVIFTIIIFSINRFTENGIKKSERRIRELQ